MVVFGTAYFLFVTFLLASARQLPERVATHFGAAGAANGWMSQSGYLVFLVAVPLALALLLWGVGTLVPRLPPRLVNIPRRDYWLAPERRSQTGAELRTHLLALAGIMTAFLATLHALTIRANRLHPPRLALDELGLVVGAFLVAVAAWTACLLWRFARVPAADSTISLD